MNLPRGRLVRSRTERDPAVALTAALERNLTGYAVLEPQDSLLLDSDASGVLTFEDGVPVLAYHTGSDRGGPSALADLAVPGPYRVELYALDAADRPTLETAHATPELRVPPAMPADRLAGDPALAERTRERAPEARLAESETNDDAETTGAVEAFLEDEAKIAAIREQARTEAKRRAEEWGLADELE